MSQKDAVLVVAEIRTIYDEESLKTYQLGARAQLSKRGGKVLGRGVPALLELPNRAADFV